MPEPAESTQRKLGLAGLESFVGAIVFQYGMIIAFLGWDTVTKTDDPNWALMAACKIGAVSAGIAIVAMYRRWASLKARLPIRLGLIPLSALVAWNSFWLATDVIYHSYWITDMGFILCFSAIPGLFAGAALLPFRYGVTACGLGGMIAGFFGLGSHHSRAFNDAYAQAGPWMGSLFAILCLGSVGPPTLQSRLVQHAGNAAAGICVFLSVAAQSIIGPASDALTGLCLLGGLTILLGLPFLLERRRLRTAAPASPSAPPPPRRRSGSERQPEEDHRD